MKFILRTFTLLSICLFSFQVSASHLMSGNITYTCTAPNTYVFIAELYTDCYSSVGLPSTVSLNVESNSCGISTTVTLELVPTGSQLIPIVCPSSPNPCTNPAAGIYGIEKYVYTHIPAAQGNGLSDLPITLSACDDWIVSFSSCCRTAQVATGSANDGIYIETVFDNIIAPCNNSPSIDFSPTFYTCLGDTTHYSNGVTDIDGDSLSYKLVDCMEGGTTPSSVNYVSSYSGQNPVANNFIDIDSTNGEIRFVATTAQISVFCVLIEEFRNGVKIGESIRDALLQVINCNANQLPTLSGINGVYGQKSVDICVGQNVCFTIDAVDSNTADSISLNFANGLVGSNVTVNQISNNSAQITVCWTPTNNQVGTHPFGIEIMDNACPLLGKNSYGYTVNVNGSLGGSAAFTETTINEGNSAALFINLLDSNCTVTWTNPTNLSCTNCINPVATPTATTIYTYQLSCSSNNCLSTITGTVTVNVIPLRTINGTITRQDGLPLTNSTVSIFNNNGNQTNTTTTDGNGNYSITTHDTAVYILATPNAINNDQLSTYYLDAIDLATATFVNLDSIQQTLDFSTLAVPTPYFIQGNITRIDGLPLDNSDVHLIDNVGNIATTVQTDNQGNYTITIPDTAINYYLKAVPNIANNDQIITYYNDDITIQTASVIDVDTTMITADFNTLGKIGNVGAKFMSGEVRQGSTTGNLLTDFRLILKDANGNVIHEHITGNNGNFIFGGLADGTYSIWADMLGVDNVLAPMIAIKSNEGSPTNLVLIVHANYIELQYPTSTIEQRNVQNLSIYPNPIQNQFTIEYDLSASANVQIEVLDVHGKTIETLVNEYQNTGKQQFIGSFSKKMIPNGIYFIRLKLDNQLIMKKIIIQNE